MKQRKWQKMKPEQTGRSSGREKNSAINLLFYPYFLIEVQLTQNAVPISAIQQSDSVLHIYIFFFKCSFPLWFIPGDWIQLPVLHSRTLLLTHSKGSSFHLPTPNSHSMPLPPPHPLDQEPPNKESQRLNFSHLENFYLKIFIFR